MVLLSIFSSMLLYITIVKKKLWNNLCSYSLYFLPRCFNYPNPKPLFFLFLFLFFLSTCSLLPHLLIFLFFHFTPHKATRNLIFLYILLFYSWPPSLTIHEEHLMQALAFLHTWNFLNIMHLLDIGMQAI